MVVFGLVKGLGSRKSVISRCMVSKQLAKYGFCCISATKEPVQPYNFISGVLSKCNRLPTSSHPFLGTHDTSFTGATGQVFYLIWQETLEVANKVVWKVTKWWKSCANFICMRAYLPWQVLMTLNLKKLYFRTSNAQFGVVSKIQSHMAILLENPYQYLKAIE